MRKTRLERKRNLEYTDLEGRIQYKNLKIDISQTSFDTTAALFLVGDKSVTFARAAIILAATFHEWLAEINVKVSVFFL